MKVLEIILAVIFGIGLFFKFNHWPGGNLLITLSLLGLSFFYYVFSFCYFNKINFKNILKKSSYNKIMPIKMIGTIGFGNGLSVLLLGILFELLNWSDEPLNIILGLFITTIIFIVSVIRFTKTKSKFYIPIFIRFFIWTLIGIISLNINL